MYFRKGKVETQSSMVNQIKYHIIKNVVGTLIELKRRYNIYLQGEERRQKKFEEIVRKLIEEN